jgi:type I restriction enzyme R subunit
LKLSEDTADYKLIPGDELGTAKAKNIQEEFLSQIINRLNELFITDQLTNKDLVNYAYTIRDKVSENQLVMMQLANNTPEQAMLGDFPKAVDDAVMDSNEAHENQMMQLLADPEKAKGFARVVFELLNSKAENIVPEEELAPGL